MFVVLIILQQPVRLFRRGRGIPVQLLFCCPFSHWRRHCVFGERVRIAAGHTDRGHGASGNISALEQSLLGFLALMVGFTFLMALTRFETRREAVLNEANAIGTTALRARLLPEPHRAESLKLLREYAQITDRLHSDGQVFCGIAERLLIVRTISRKRYGSR